MFNWIYLGSFAAIVGLALSIGTTIHAVLNKRDSRAVIAWVGLAWLAPFLGSTAYLILGINRIRRKARALREQAPPAADRDLYLPEDLVDRW